MIAALSAVCAFTGCNNASKQRTGNTSSETNLPSCQKTSQDKPNVIEIDGTPYLALNKLLVLPDDAKTVAIPLPVSFYSYYRDIPKIIKLKATTSLRISCLFCIFKHSPPKKRFDGQNGGN